MKSIPLVVHLIYKLDFGGLETMMVERINRMPAEKYRHAIICLTDYTEFSKKISKQNVQLFSLHKSPGLSLTTHFRLWQLLRQLRPAIMHSYNLSAIEYAAVAMLARVPVRINGAHGRDSNDPDGSNKKHNFLRRMLTPLHATYYAVSDDLKNWLTNIIGVPDNKNRLLTNGIDIEKFCPETKPDALNEISERYDNCIVFGTVGRIQAIKDHSNLIDAFILLLKIAPQHRHRMRLVIVGDGPLLLSLQTKIAQEGIEDLVWLAGARTDIAELMRGFSVFVLSSIAEGTPVTILEAMASGLPVVATRVGGIPEVVIDGETGRLVPPSDAQALANALVPYLEQSNLAQLQGAAGRMRIEKKYSMNSMVAAYMEMYDDMRATRNKI